jgi:hypothetical protein
MSPVLPSTWKVPELFHSRLGEQAGRQRMMTADGHLLLILHKLPESGSFDRVPIIFWRDSAGAWKSTGGGAGIADLKEQLDQFNKAVDKLEQQIQQPPNSANYFDILQDTGPLLRLVRNMHGTLQQAREAFPDDRHILNARDQAGELERELELIHADAKNGLEFIFARQAELEAKNTKQLVSAQHRLNMLIAVFLPLTALGSAFGMNFRHGLESITTPILFWSVLVTGIFLGLIVKGAISKEEKDEEPKR